MNVLIVKENEALDDNIKNICDYYENNVNEFNENIKFLYEKKGKIKIDLYLLFSNSIEFIEEKFKKCKDSKNILILTNNFDSKHIISCLILTENLFSVRKSEKYIVDKIIEVYSNLKRRESKVSNVCIS